MNVVRIVTSEDRFFNECMNLYEESFPYNEKRERGQLLKDLDDDRFRFCCFREEGSGDFIGFFTYWILRGEYLYGEHFAVEPAKRGSGAGACILKYVKGLGYPIILEIEEPVDDITMRRESFYLRNGFLLNGHIHLQPPYHRDTSPLKMKILTFPEHFSLEEYEKFREDQLQIIRF